MAGRTLVLALAALLSPALLSCRYDPVPQEIIDDLGPETGTPGATHRPGQPCLACHSSYAGTAPQMVFGGTIYVLDDKDAIVPAAGVPVSVFDSAGTSKKACTNPAGNFFLEKEAWKDVAFPLTVQVGTPGSSSMSSLIGRDGSCASCHKAPDPEADPPRNPTTGAGHDSPGLIILLDIAETGQCGGGS
jgi:hypothetical protein